MRTVARIITYLVCVVIHVSGIPNPATDVTDKVTCLSFARAEANGIDVDALREEYTAAVEAFPGRRDEVAAAWSDLQFELRDRLREVGLTDLGGRSLFSVVLFEPDGRIARVFYQGLNSDEEAAFCEVVSRLAGDYRFPLQSTARFSQCGTTHFKAN